MSKLLLILIIIGMMMSFMACKPFPVTQSPTSDVSTTTAPPPTLTTVSKSGVEGTYINQSNSNEFLELHGDNTFFIKQGGSAYSGTWQQKGDEVRITWMGHTSVLIIKGGKFEAERGEIWSKQPIQKQLPIVSGNADDGVTSTSSNINLPLDQQLVIDEAKIFGNRISEVERATNKLLEQGADIRVRTISTYGIAGNLDQYEAQLEKQSPSWIDQNGQRKSKLIVIIISLKEQRTGLYYGSFWENTLSSRWSSIQSNVMNPLFRTGDYINGMIKGLEEIQKLVGVNQ